MSQQIYDSINESNYGWRQYGQERFVFVTALLAIFFSLCALSLTMTIHIRERNHETVTNVLNNTPIACVPCAKLIKSINANDHTDPLISKLTTVQDQDGVMKCCAYYSEQMSAVLELAMRRQESNPEPLPEFEPADFSFSQVSAHLRLYPPNREFNSTVPEFDKIVMTRFKMDNRSIGEHARGVNVQEDGLHILTSGQYFIYSSIHFRPESVYPCRDFKYQTWEHYVTKITPNYPDATGYILKTAHTCCDECTGDDETSYTSGVFELKKGDIIRILVSGHGLVFFKKFSSFAGLMLFG